MCSGVILTGKVASLFVCIIFSSAFTRTSLDACLCATVRHSSDFHKLRSLLLSIKLSRLSVHS